MPRLTLQDYLTTRDYLAELWIERDGLGFSALPGHAQRDLHDYFAPSVSMTVREATLHRQEMTNAFPTLPQKAGRTVAALRAHLEGRPSQMVDRRREKISGTFDSAGKTYTIRVEPERRPHVDTYRLARALVSLSKSDVDGKLLAKARKQRERRERNS
jgi:hypothetical protein